MAERGDIILDGLMRIVAGLLLSALLVFEVGAVLVNRVQVDGKAQEAARTGATVWNSHGDVELTEEAVETVVQSLPGAVVADSVVEKDAIIVWVEREAPVLVAHRLTFLEERLMARVRARAEFDR